MAFVHAPMAITWPKMMTDEATRFNVFLDKTHFGLSNGSKKPFIDLFLEEPGQNKPSGVQPHCWLTNGRGRQRNKKAALLFVGSMTI